MWDPQKHPDYMLPEGTGWEWDGEWTLDMTGTDSEGWLYSFNFVRSPLQRLSGEDIKWYSTCNPNPMMPTFVRRRKWVRRAVNTAKLKSVGGLSPTTTDGELHGTPVSMVRTSTTRAALSDLLEGRGGRLPKDVSVQYLQTAGGGTALEGHMHKEGRGWPRTWEERYFVLWPKRPVLGRQLGFEREFQLLFYFKNIDSTAASGVGMVSLPSVAVTGLRTTSTNMKSDSMFMQTRVQMEHYTAQEAKQRHGFDCRKMVYDEIVEMKPSPDGTVRPEIQPRVLKIGVRLATTAGRVSSSSPEITGDLERQTNATVGDMAQWERALIGERVCLSAGALSRQVEWKYEGASGLNPLRWSKKPLADVVTDLRRPTTEDRPVKIRFPGRPDSQTFEKPTQAVKWLLSLDLDALALAAGESMMTDGTNESQCWKCKTEFGWLTRRHHCRACKRAFCDSCSQHKAEVRGMNAQQRVCDECHLEVQSPQLDAPPSPTTADSLEPEPEPEDDTAPKTE